jgi:tetratricopeptide (TPR) repeat protein
MAWEALFLLSFLGPDNLTKPILRALLTAKQSSEKITAKDATAASSDSKTKHTIISGLYYAIPCGIMACTVLCTLLLPARRHIKGVWTFGIGTTLIGAWVAATIPMRTEDGQLPVQMDDTNIQPSSLASYSEGGSSESSDSKSDDGTPVDVFEMTDRVWTILKSYSLLDVKEGKGSMHRLLSHALQVYQTKNERHQNLEVCVRAIQQLWTFKPELVDSWQSASQYLDHVKSIVSHVAATPGFLILEAATLSREAGMLSAMALNRFVESQYSLELALRILDFGDGKRQPEFVVCKAACLHELGKVFRYHGSELRARETLSQALELRTKLAEKDIQSRRDVASTLHELGVLAVKNHNLSDAAGFLDQSLRLRQTLQSEFKDDDEIEAECAATLHQLAAVQVSRKPPCLDKAEALLRKALTLNMNIGQRAATMKQLARVSTIYDLVCCDQKRVTLSLSRTHCV